MDVRTALPKEIDQLAEALVRAWRREILREVRMAPGRRRRQPARNWLDGNFSTGSLALRKTHALRYFSTPNVNTVLDAKVSPGRSIVDGNVGWFGESGKCWVSRQKPIALPIRAPLLARDGAVQKVAGVELHAGLGGRDVQRPAGGRLDDARGVAQPDRRRPFEHEVVVVAARRVESAGVGASIRAPMVAGCGNRTACRRPAPARRSESVSRRPACTDPHRACSR